MNNDDLDKPAEILLVEDNPGDVRLMKQVFILGNVRSNLHSVADGEEAMAFLRREGPYADAMRPALILLDLNMPKMDGREVLSELKQAPDLMTIPVIVLTTSEAELDLLNSYRLHANCYINKPASLAQMIKVVKSITEFWTHIVTLPPRTVVDDKSLGGIETGAGSALARSSRHDEPLLQAVADLIGEADA